MALPNTANQNDWILYINGEASGIAQSVTLPEVAVVTKTVRQPGRKADYQLPAGAEVPTNLTVERCYPINGSTVDQWQSMAKSLNRESQSDVIRVDRIGSQAQVVETYEYTGFLQKITESGWTADKDNALQTLEYAINGITITGAGIVNEVFTEN